MEVGFGKVDLGGGDVDCCDGVSAFEEGASAEDACAAAEFEDVGAIVVVGWVREVGEELIKVGVSGIAHGGMFEGKGQVRRGDVIVASFDDGSGIGGVEIGHDDKSRY